MTRLVLLLLLLVAAPAYADLTAAVLAMAHDGDYLPREFRGEAGERLTADLAVLFEIASTETGEPALLLAAVARNESSFRQNATGPAFEIGLMQLHPRHLPDGCADVKRLRQYRSFNIICGARELAAWRRTCGQAPTFRGTDKDTLSAYQSGRCSSSTGRAYAARVLRHLARGLAAGSGG